MQQVANLIITVDGVILEDTYDISDYRSGKVQDVMECYPPEVAYLAGYYNIDGKVKAAINDRQHNSMDYYGKTIEQLYTMMESLKNSISKGEI